MDKKLQKRYYVTAVKITIFKLDTDPGGRKWLKIGGADFGQNRTITAIGVGTREKWLRGLG
jgi:hypothetical protein